MIKDVIKKLFLFFALLIFNQQNLYAKEKLSFATWEWAPITSSEIEGYGIATEIVKKAYEAEGVDIDLVFYPWRRCERMIRNNEVNATFPYTKTEGRKKEYYFSDPILTVKTKFFYLKDKIKEKPELKSYKDLKKYSIGGVLGYFYKNKFDEAGLNVEYVGSDEQNFKRLVMGRVDIIPMTNINGMYLIKKNFPEHYDRIASTDFEPLGKKESEGGNNIRVIVSKYNPKGKEILQTYNRGIKKIKQNGEYQKILNKYGVTQTKSDIVVR